jgi:hypothetical protein
VSCSGWKQNIFAQVVQKDFCSKEADTGILRACVLYMIFVKADPEFLKGKQNRKAKTLARTKGKCFPLVSIARFA